MVISGVYKFWEANQALPLSIGRYDKSVIKQIHIYFIMPEPSGMLYLASNSCLSVKISFLLLPHLQCTFFSSFTTLKTAYSDFSKKSHHVKLCIGWNLYLEFS